MEEEHLNTSTPLEVWGLADGPAPSLLEIMPRYKKKKRDARVKTSGTPTCRFIIQRDCAALLVFVAVKAQMCLTYFANVRVPLQAWKLSGSWKEALDCCFMDLRIWNNESFIPNEMNTEVMNTP